MQDKLWVRRFDVGQDLFYISKWLEQRDRSLSHEDDLPALGWIAEWEGLPVAAIFLRQCEGGVAMIDSLVSNPEALGHTRHIAIDSLVLELFTHAKSLGLKRVFAFSIDKGTIERSQRHGFSSLPHTLISLKL